MLKACHYQKPLWPVFLHPFTKMSTSSGILASQELLDSFKAFVETDASVLISTISNEKVELKEIIQDNSMPSAIKTLNSKLSDSKPNYIIIRNKDSKNSFTFVSFVPDYSAVKDKMIYASSKNNFIRSLGSELFANVLFWNALEEVSLDSLESSIDNSDSKKNLSKEEQEISKIKDLELDTLIHSSTQRRKLVAHSNSNELSFRFHENVEGITLSDNELHSFNIELPTEVIFLSNSNSSVSEPRHILDSISADYPQYNILKFNGKTFFIYSCPSGSKVKERMIYASNKQGVLNQFRKIFDTIDIQSIEIGDPDELELSTFEPEKEISTQSSNNLKFSRPARPGRRR